MKRLFRRWLEGETIEGRIYQRNLVNGKPDLVRYLVVFAKSRFLTSGWTKLPIDIPEEEYSAWHEHDYAVTIDKLREQQYGVLGSFLKLAGQNPAITAELLVEQVDLRLKRLREAANQPVDYYTPQEFDEEEALEEGPMREEWKFELPFDLLEDLEWFKLGMENARLHCFDDNPELGLPNMGLFGALLEVHLDRVESTIVAAEPKLKAILKHLAATGYKNSRGEIAVNDRVAPDAFWWRHWKPGKSPKK